MPFMIIFILIMIFFKDFFFKIYFGCLLKTNNYKRGLELIHYNSTPKIVL